MISPLYHHDITSHITVPPKVLCCFEERSFQLTARRGGSFFRVRGPKMVVNRSTMFKHDINYVLTILTILTMVNQG
jgi:hypothetical protein